MSLFSKGALIGIFAPLLFGQINILDVTASTTQTVITYISPVEATCSLKVADMDRSIKVLSSTQAAGQVTVETSVPHGLLPGSMIYVEQSGTAAWDGWQTITGTPTPTRLTFDNALKGAGAGGNIGVLVDDVNPRLFPNADQDNRVGNVTSVQDRRIGPPRTLTGSPYKTRSFVVGLRYAQFASDSNRHSRALQANARHHYTLTCGTQSLDREFQTQNIPLGDTHNDGPLGDRNHPGQYAYPTIQWTNQNQALIDPVSGLRSFRVTKPSGAPSTMQSFATAADQKSSWVNTNAALASTGSAARYTGGTCQQSPCPLFLRADALSLPGGATYTADGSSFDWFTVSIADASINNSACIGDDCKALACLTIDGQRCVSDKKELSLTMTPSTYTLGSGTLMDLWQLSGTAPGFSRVDVSRATGMVTYVATTKAVTKVGGNPFNLRWGSGSTINIGGAEFPIASVINELTLTLASGPTSDLTSPTAYSANNFGALVWKKTETPDTISIGHTTYQYGSTPMPQWAAAPHNPSSPPVPASGKTGYNTFVERELYWIAADGSETRDLGLIAESYYSPFWFQEGAPCGSSDTAYAFDPANGDIWYCFQSIYYSPSNTRSGAIVQAHYLGPHDRGAPGVKIPDCSVSKGAQPCILFTVMQPKQADAVDNSAPLFNPDYATSGFVNVGNWQFAGVSADGDLAVFTTASGQDWPGWIFIYSLGDRTPMGTGSGSMKLVAGGSTYRKSPLSWCSIHGVFPPDNGWVVITSNDLLMDGPKGTYTMNLTSAPLNTSVGIPGGLNACPENTFGVRGNLCTSVTVSGPPASAFDGRVLQNQQAGDIVEMETTGGLHEHMRILTVDSPASFTLQRGYPEGAVAAHSSKTFTMLCGTRNGNDSALGLWHYRSDAFGANSGGTTVLSDPDSLQGHGNQTGGIPIPDASVTATDTYNVPNGATICPIAKGTDCYQVRRGYLSTALASPAVMVASSPPFADHVGIGQSNFVDMHPGPSFNGWHVDARPMFGASAPGSGSSPFALGPYSAPWVNVSGQLWKVSRADTVLHRKFLSTMAYVGRFPLVDVSGPSSAIKSGADDSYKYCYALRSDECVVGSTSGDVYVNAPFVSYPYCRYPGIAVQDDDSNGICIADLGANTGNMTQTGHAAEDLVGAATRRLGPNYSSWNQQYVFWNNNLTPNGAVLLTRARWLDEIRHEDLLTILPPYPAQDQLSRNTFLPYVVTTSRPADVPVVTAVVEFGYAENGSASNYFCTSRQETCVAVDAAINPANPFYFEASERYVGMPCTAGCTITLPALSQRVIYYRWRFLGGNGDVVGVGPTQVIVTQ